MAVGVQRHDSADPRCESPLDPDVPVLDPHLHVMERGWIAYQPGDLATDARAGHRVEASIYLECDSAYRESGPSHLRSVGETEHYLRCSTDPTLPEGALAGMVASVDLALGPLRVREALEAHVAVAGERLVGVRYSVAWAPGRDNGRRRPDMFANPAIDAGLDILRDFGLPLDSWLYPSQFDQLARVAERHGDIVFVVNHLGSPLSGVTDPRERPAAFAAWRSAIERTARCVNVMLKIGGLTAPMLGGPWAPASAPGSTHIADFWREPVEVAVATFGAERCLFESNFPIDGIVADYVTIWNAHKRLAAPYSQSERSALLHDTAARIYGLAPSGP